MILSVNATFCLAAHLMHSIRYMCVFVCLSAYLVYMYDCIQSQKKLICDNNLCKSHSRINVLVLGGFFA